jgi:DNA polymerase III alpha subunit
LIECLKACAKPKKEGGGVHGTARCNIVKSLALSLESPPTSLDDKPQWIAATEEILLGIPITCSQIDSCDTSVVNCTCKDFINSTVPGALFLGVVIQAVREITNKKREKQAFLTVADSSCAISDVVIFSKEWTTYKSLLREGNTVILQGEKDRRRGGLIVKRVWQANEIGGI